MRVLALLCLAVLSVSAAAEPDGDFVLRLERLPSSNGSTVVRLTVRPFAAVGDAALTVSAPAGFDLQPRTPGRHDRIEALATPDGSTSLRAPLRGLDPSSLSTLEFELVLPPGTHGTFDFVVEGRDDRGRKLRGAVGLLLPDPASRGVRRLGAVEFPAVVLPDESER